MKWQLLKTAPKEFQDVLLGHPDGSMSVAHWDGSKWTDGQYECTWATHWVKLPKPPENKDV